MWRSLFPPHWWRSGCRDRLVRARVRTHRLPGRPVPAGRALPAYSITLTASIRRARLRHDGQGLRLHAARAVRFHLKRPFPHLLGGPGRTRRQRTGDHAGASGGGIAVQACRRNCRQRSLPAQSSSDLRSINRRRVVRSGSPAGPKGGAFRSGRVGDLYPFSASDPRRGGRRHTSGTESDSVRSYRQVV